MPPAAGGVDASRDTSLPGRVEWLAPSGARSRVAANLQALRILAEIEREERSATVAERELLARWSSWGAVPTIFDETREEWAAERDELRVLLGDERHWAQARRTTINAHYTHPEIATAMWDLASESDSSADGCLNPGVAPASSSASRLLGAEMVGVRLDDTTAAIAQALHPDASVISRSFADYRPREQFDLGAAPSEGRYASRGITLLTYRWSWLRWRSWARW